MDNTKIYSTSLPVDQSEPESPQYVSLTDKCHGIDEKKERLQTASRPLQTNSALKKGSFSSSVLSASGFLLDLQNYIPAGCLRVERYRWNIKPENWPESRTWQLLAHPGDYLGFEKPDLLPSALQESLFNGSPIQSFRPLHWAGWIRMEFKANDMDYGQIRVFILPDDVGRRMLDRKDVSLRKILARLLSELDTARATWEGKWSEEIPITHVDHGLDSLNPGRFEANLFALYNDLNSPTPNPEIVKDKYANLAMFDILNGEVEGLKTIMLPYQRRTAAMMLQREASPSQMLDPRLQQIKDQQGKIWYCDSSCGTCLREPRMYDLARGGICAETMGLGKTLICLALILATKEHSSQIPVEYSVGTIPVRKRVGSLLDICAATIGRTGTPWKRHLEDSTEDGLEYSKCIEAIRKSPGSYEIPTPVPPRATRNPVIIPPRRIYLSTATIVVVPTNLVRQWEYEIEKHTTGLEVLVLNDLQKDLPPPMELAGYDIILFSRQRFDKEARDGSDQQGRRSSQGRCRCLPDSMASCTCFNADSVYRSPLRQIHFKRLITDEGHTMGNSSTKAKTQAVIVIDGLQLSARWIISGTPTPGLYGDEFSFSLAPFIDSASSSKPQESAAVLPVLELQMVSASSDDNRQKTLASEYEEERKDLEKLGNIAKHYLQCAPWTEDASLWSQYVMQPRHGSKSSGNLACLKATLEGMIIRHRPEDVAKDIQLPPLFQKTVYLRGSLFDNLSLNLFTFMIIANAITSERKDADYFFHPRQRKSLAELVANLRSASFFWCGFTREDIEFTLSVITKYRTASLHFLSKDDKKLIWQAIKMGRMALSSPIWLAASENHEIAFYLANNFPPEVCRAWTLDKGSTSPSLFGASQLILLQKLMNSKISMPNLILSLEQAGQAAKDALYTSLEKPAPRLKGKMGKVQQKLENGLPALSGGVNIGSEASPRKQTLLATSRRLKINSAHIPLAHSTIRANQSRSVTEEVRSQPHWMQNASKSIESSPQRTSNPKGVDYAEIPNYIGSSVYPQSNVWGVSSSSDSDRKDFSQELEGVQPSDETTYNASEESTSKILPLPSLKAATIMSTASTKLSYLMDQVFRLHKEEKIIIFYESDNIAFYIAQGLEAIGVNHLIYAKTLTSDRRSRYLVTFNTSPSFRCLLMDVSQAAFGLDISSASRIFFVTPVISKQVEAQAVKRAHRIGQTRPVYVETLVLQSSIEEVIIERRNDMSSDEQKKCKTVLDDQKMYDWIKNVRFVGLPHRKSPGPQQMATLSTQPPAFGHETDTLGDLALVKIVSDAVTEPLQLNKKHTLDSEARSDTEDSAVLGPSASPINHYPGELAKRVRFAD